MAATKDLYHKISNFLFGKRNREIFVFVFFLMCSAAVWCALALNDTYEQEFKIPVRLVEVPKNVVITTPIEDSVRVVLRDKGFALLNYQFTANNAIEIDFAQWQKTADRGSITAAELQKLIYLQLSASTKITSIKPDRMEYYFNYGLQKQVPVHIEGKVQPAQNYYLADIQFSPELVTVYASKQVLDSIRYVCTKPLNITNFVDSIQKEVELLPIKGVKTIPSKVKVTFYPDILTEQVVEVPVTSANMPNGKTLRTFPSKVKIHFTIGASQYRRLNTDLFRVEADYNEIMSGAEDKCRIHLVSVPNEASKATLEMELVDYLIESVE